MSSGGHALRLNRRPRVLWVMHEAEKARRRSMDPERSRPPTDLPLPSVLFRWRIEFCALRKETRKRVRGSHASEVSPNRRVDWGKIEFRWKSQRQERHAVACSVHSSCLS